ncbi:hypothetical protein CL1_1728 [Thermococcus cleftensis]|uniref:Uncharacterized protein n=1 Tax=Thermococcus cleftensis (strain DSM 27260 / KACC 17922 / CL1) TaxID=163003 RepID=I3ZW41_THECF|nr:PEGA domain-containing protein [Thermococcus cleftensis]AFL95925.1 hypothetical protein CL1_1728 [Thermococcus cleftensis]
MRHAGFIVALGMILALLSPLATAAAPTWTKGIGVYSVCISPDGRAIFAGVEDGVYLFDRNGTEVWHTELPEAIKLLAVSPDMKYVVGAGEKDVYVINASSGEFLWSTDTKGKIESLAASGDRFVVGTLFSVEAYRYTGKLTFLRFPETQTTGGVAMAAEVGYSVGFADKAIVVAGDKVIYYRADGTEGWKYDPYADSSADRNFEALAISPDNSLIAAGGKDGVWILDVYGTFRDKLTVPNVIDLEFTPDGEYIAILTSDGKVYLADRNGNVEWSKATRGVPKNLAVTLHYVGIATDKGVEVLTIKDGSSVNFYDLGNTNSVAGTEKADYLAAGGEKLGFFNFNYAVLTVKTNPSGAEVYINGVYKGTSPLSLTINPGKYKITVSMEGYYSNETTVTLDLGESETVTLTLEKRSEIETPTGTVTTTTTSPQVSMEKYRLGGQEINFQPSEGYLREVSSYAIQKTEELIDKMNGLGYSADLAGPILEKARQEYLNGNYAAARDKALEAWITAFREFWVQYDTAILSKGGIDVSPVEESYKSGNLEDALGKAVSMSGKLEGEQKELFDAADGAAAVVDEYWRKDVRLWNYVDPLLDSAGKFKDGDVKGAKELAENARAALENVGKNGEKALSEILAQARTGGLSEEKLKEFEMGNFGDVETETQTKEGGGGICGPGLFAIPALLPALLHRRVRR